MTKFTKDICHKPSGSTYASNNYGTVLTLDMWNNVESAIKELKSHLHDLEHLVHTLQDDVDRLSSNQ